MKALSLILSLVVFFIAGYYFVNDFNLSGEMNHMIYMSLLVILMLICIVGILINVPLIVEERRKMKALVKSKLIRKHAHRKLEMNFET